SELTQAKKYVQKALLPKSLNLEDKINYLNTLANIELDLGHLENANTLNTESKQLYEENSIFKSDPDLLEPILITLSQILIEKCEFEQAERILLENLESLKSKGLDRFPIIAAVYSNLGTTWLERGEFERAKKFFKKSIEVLTNLFDEDHPKIALEYNNLGLAYYYNHEFFYAKRFFRKGLEINEKIYSDSLTNIYLATNYNNLGMTYEIIGDVEKAYDYYSMSLEIYDKLFGYNHPSAASTLYNLGNVYYVKKEYTMALENLEKALEIDRKFYNENHLEVAKDLAKIGAVFIDIDNLVNSEEYSLKALNIFQTHSPNSLDTSMVHLNLSILYIKKLEMQKSKQHIQAALEIVHENYGKDHNQLRVIFDTY
ncbi:tetratricopeptide repeat protein, partial [Peribacillus simplex]